MTTKPQNTLFTSDRTWIVGPSLSDVIVRLQNKADGAVVVTSVEAPTQDIKFSVVFMLEGKLASGYIYERAATLWEVEYLS